MHTFYNLLKFEFDETISVFVSCSALTFMCQLRSESTLLMLTLFIKFMHVEINVTCTLTSMKYICDIGNRQFHYLNKVYFKK
jgi:hypothetical protein